jgi:hypothetical protein
MSGLELAGWLTGAVSAAVAVGILVLRIEARRTKRERAALKVYVTTYDDCYHLDMGCPAMGSDGYDLVTGVPPKLYPCLTCATKL